MADEELGKGTFADFERFFFFTQQMETKFGAATIDEKRAALFLVCTKLTLQDHQGSADYREPFASLAAFPLAGMPDDNQSERKKWRTTTKNSQIMDSWLGMLDAIRTFSLRVPHGRQTAETGTGTSAYPHCPTVLYVTTRIDGRLFSAKSRLTWVMSRPFGEKGSQSLNVLERHVRESYIMHQSFA
jgi:hypothetical protein